MNTVETSSMHEEALLSQDTDIFSAATSSTNDLIFAVLQSLNKNMAAMGELLRSLKQNGEAQTSPTAESAKKRKSPSIGDDSDSEVSDADTLRPHHNGVHFKVGTRCNCNT